MRIKQTHVVHLETSLSGLPRTWKTTLTAVVGQVGEAYSLYITDIALGERRAPDGVVVSFKRQGAAEAWTPRVEGALRQRLLSELELLRQDEVARGVQSLGLATRRSPLRIRAAEGPVPADPRELQARDAARRKAVDDLADALKAARLSEPVRQLADLALWQMRDPQRFSLWAQVLLAVDAVEDALPAPLAQRVAALIG